MVFPPGASQALLKKRQNLLLQFAAGEAPIEEDKYMIRF
jgi:hypothetical protein